HDPQSRCSHPDCRVRVCHHPRLRLHRHQPESAGRCCDPRPHARIRLPHAVERARHPRRQGDERHAARRRQGPRLHLALCHCRRNALGLPAILDGLNDQGLSVGLFYFPNYAKYTDVTPENAKHAIAPQEFGMWVLANFATVDEVKEGVKSIVVVPTPAPGLGSPQGAVAGAHFFIQDKSGKSIVIEPVDGTLKVHDAPLGIMTNAPTYDWHMTNLQNYINLSVKDVEGAKLGPVTLPAFGSGSGLHGIPGDFTPPSRFVRAAIYGQSAAPNDTAEDAVLSAFHILNQFDIPKGSVQNSAIGGTVDEITEWTSVADLKNLRWYFRTFTDQSIHVVDLKE